MTIPQKPKTTTKDPPHATASPTEELVLLALYPAKELYGLQIPQAMSDASNGRRKFKIGSLYPALHSLEQKGLLESRWGDDTPENRGGARRRYYKLTGQGVATLESILEFRNRLLQWQPT